jgi:hypothetical protein
MIGAILAVDDAGSMKKFETAQVDPLSNDRSIRYRDDVEDAVDAYKKIPTYADVVVPRLTPVPLLLADPD